MMSFNPNFPEISDDITEVRMTKNKSGVAAAFMRVIMTFPNSPKTATLLPKTTPVIAPIKRAIIICVDSELKYFFIFGPLVNQDCLIKKVGNKGNLTLILYFLTFGLNSKNTLQSN